MSTSNHFDSTIRDLPPARMTELVELADGEELDLRIAPVAKQLGEATARMLSYNGSIPGPTLKVRERSEIVVNIENRAELEATVHWHGLRLENRFDGTHETQRPIRTGERYSARLSFPDPGIYWYHPHIREDYAQELGLYGCIIVEPADSEYWPPVHREMALTLDDILVEDGNVASFRRDETTHVAMGRFGDVLLINGEADLSLTARLGEVVRLYLTNTANTRVFKAVLPGARMKIVGGDSGHVEHEQFVDEVILAPSERVVVDVRFDQPGEVMLEHRTPSRVYPLAAITVSDERAEPDLSLQFESLRHNEDMRRERDRVRPLFDAPPDKTVSLIAEMDVEASEEADGHGGHQAHESHEHSTVEGIEWEDEMPEVNRMTTPANMRWKLVDRETGAENAEISWRFSVGDQVKIRLANEMVGDHRMHHPFHVHGAGRFLVLSRDGVSEPNLVWKDTVLLRAGETVDILLDVTNPGRWMAHCHIAEHHESGMLFSFDVDP